MQWPLNSPFSRLPQASAARSRCVLAASPPASPAASPSRASRPRLDTRRFSHSETNGLGPSISQLELRCTPAAVAHQHGRRSVRRRPKNRRRVRKIPFGVGFDRRHVGKRIASRRRERQVQWCSWAKSHLCQTHSSCQSLCSRQASMPVQSNKALRATFRFARVVGERQHRPLRRSNRSRPEPTPAVPRRELCHRHLCVGVGQRRRRGRRPAPEHSAPSISVSPEHLVGEQYVHKA